MAERKMTGGNVKFLTRIAILFYVTLIMFISCFVLLLVLNYIDVQPLINMVTVMYSDEALRMTFAIGACALLFLNYVFYRAFTGSSRAEKTIAFDNPAGRVSVSLGAIEDLTKRVIGRIAEVREVKSKISASKKGLLIRIKLILRAEGSIPEVTSRVQELVKRKVQSTIGLDEPIEVAIFVGKILPDQGREKEPIKKEDLQKDQQNIPFQGYRA
ncbi:MAG: alkaline shock response membrane anchor protein AmaP [Candidatus Omnitrophica bacterium]|nr:alkaline shock response membrane anchor protein AmaP [Candidatus Omnitrophota bacterium]